jgi:hypothetical protein
MVRSYGTENEPIIRLREPYMFKNLGRRSEGHMEETVKGGLGRGTWIDIAN